MPDEPSLDFPCEIPIKILGRNDDTFRAAVREVIGKHFAGVADEALKERLSRKDNWLGITATVLAESRSQIDACYRDLSAHEHIMMVL